MKTKQDIERVELFQHNNRHHRSASPYGLIRLTVSCYQECKMIYFKTLLIFRKRHLRVFVGVSSIPEKSLGRYVTLCIPYSHKAYVCLHVKISRKGSILTYTGSNVNNQASIGSVNAKSTTHDFAKT